LAELGQFAKAAEHTAEAIRLAESTQHHFTINWAYFAASMLHLAKGDWAEALAQVKRWLTTIQTGNITIHLPWAVSAFAWVLAQLGEGSQALDRAREGEQLLEQQEARGIVSHRIWAYGALGRAFLLLDRLDEARRLGGRALESSRRQPGVRAHALHLLGDVATHPDRFDAESGATYYREALALAQVHGMRPLVAHCHLGLGKLYRRNGEADLARDNLAAAATMYREMDMGFWLEQGNTV
jgi:tetratricopeptide (TPR) repeat protein